MSNQALIQRIDDTVVGMYDDDRKCDNANQVFDKHPKATKESRNDQMSRMWC